MVEEDGRTGVVVKAREKPQGPNYIQAGFLLQTDFSGTYESSLRVALLRSPVTEYGAEARILTALGSEAGLWGEYYHPFDPQARWYFYGRAGIQNRTTPLFNDSGHRIATYDTVVGGGGISLGRTFGLFGAAELGVQRTESRSDLEVGNPVLPDLEVGTGAVFGFVSIDRLDSLYFPRSGYSARLDYRATASWLGGEADFEEAGIDVLGAVPFGRHAIQYGASYQTTLSGVLPLYERYSMGGRGRLIGFHYNELTGQNYAVVTVGYSYQLAEVFGRSAVVGSTPGVRQRLEPAPRHGLEGRHLQRQRLHRLRLVDRADAVRLRHARRRRGRAVPGDRQAVLSAASGPRVVSAADAVERGSGPAAGAACRFATRDGRAEPGSAGGHDDRWTSGARPARRVTLSRSRQRGGGAVKYFLMAALVMLALPAQAATPQSGLGTSGKGAPWSRSTPPRRGPSSRWRVAARRRSRPAIR